ncbi:MAG: hypothetical protein P1U32_04355 [Legionellaceae bacterium]|nr:hypothetical protein [Legionellaceae bacterium]
MNLGIEVRYSQLDDADFGEFQHALRALDCAGLIQNRACVTTPFLKRVMEGAHAWSVDVPSSDESAQAFADVQHLINLMKGSTETSFSAFIQEIERSDSGAYNTYQTLESELFPGLGFDGQLIFDAMRENGKSIKSLIPPQFRPYQTAIERVKGAPASHLLGALFGYALGFAPYILGGILARELTGLTEYQRMTLAAAPTALGGIFRLWAAQKADEGRGKQAISTLFTISLCGLLGILYYVEKTELPEVKGDDLTYWGLMFANALSGAGIATFSAAMPMAARSAPDDIDKLAERDARLSQLTGTEIRSTWFGRLLRKGPADHMAVIAGVGGLTPPIALITASALVPELGLDGTYALFGAMTLTGQLGLQVFWQNLVLDQLREQGVPMPIAGDIARWMGQKQQVNPDMTFFQKLRALKHSQLHALMTVCSSYIATFGVLMAFTSTGTLMLERRGMSSQAAAGLIAAVSGVSTLVRSGMAMPKWSVGAGTITNVSLAVMATSLLLFAISERESDWLPLLFVFAIANGGGNYAVFAQIAEDLSDIVGLASGLAGGIGACSAIFINVCFARLVSLNQMITAPEKGVSATKTANEYLLGAAICSLCLVNNIIYECAKSSRAENHVMSEEETQPLAEKKRRYDSFEIERGGMSPG